MLNSTLHPPLCLGLIQFRKGIRKWFTGVFMTFVPSSRRLPGSICVCVSRSVSVTYGPSDSYLSSSLLWEDRETECHSRWSPEDNNLHPFSRVPQRGIIHIHTPWTTHFLLPLRSLDSFTEVCVLRFREPFPYVIWMGISKLLRRLNLERSHCYTGFGPS